jgi:hypothetical protein
MGGVQLGVVGLILLLGSYPCYLMFLKKGWVQMPIHPYTQKKYAGWLFYEFSRCYYLVLGSVFFLMTQQFLFSLIVALFAWFSFWNFRRVNQKSLAEEIILAWEEPTSSYSAEGWLKRRIKTPKLVITDNWVYLKKNLRLSPVKKNGNVFQLMRIVKTKKELIFTYGYLGIPVRSILIEIPDRLPHEILKKLDKWVKEKA